MKVYRVEANETDFDEYYSIIVVAENEKRALEIARRGNPWNYGLPLDQQDIGSIFWEFNNGQEPLSVIEINLSEEQVIVSSYRGG